MAIWTTYTGMEIKCLRKFLQKNPKYFIKKLFGNYNFKKFKKDYVELSMMEKMLKNIIKFEKMI